MFRQEAEERRQGKALSDAEAEFRRCREEQSTLSNCAADAERWKQFAEEARRGLAELTELSQAYDGLCTAQRQAQTLLRKWEAALQDAANTQMRYQHLAAAWFTQQAGHLAQSLQTGTPCPVCGSVDHPAPAQLPEEAVDKAAVEQAERQRDQAQQTESAARRSYDTAQIDAENRENQLLAKAKALLATQNLSALPAALATRKTILDGQQKEAVAAWHKAQEGAKRFDVLAKLLPTQEEALNKLRLRLSELSAAIASGKATVDALTSQLAALSERLPHPDKLTAQREIARLRKEAAGIEQAIAHADTAHRQAAESLKGHQGQAEAFRSQIAGMPEIDLAAIESQIAALDAQRNDLTQAQRAVIVRLDRCRSVKAQISAAQEALIREDAKLAWLSELSRTANGRLEGREKIMLESYVQMAYFERILLHANRRMKAMSRGQYELVRANAADKRSQSGLELNVRDYVNGTAGGEPLRRRGLPGQPVPGAGHVGRDPGPGGRHRAGRALRGRGLRLPGRGTAANRHRDAAIPERKPPPGRRHQPCAGAAGAHFPQDHRPQRRGRRKPGQDRGVNPTFLKNFPNLFEFPGRKREAGSLYG